MDTAVRKVKDELSLPIDIHLLKEAKTYKQAERPHYDHLFFMRLDGSEPDIRRLRWRFWSWVQIKRVGWFDLSDPAIWPKLTHETRVALKVYDQHLNLGLSNDV